MISWWNDELLGAWYDQQYAGQQTIPAAERCWKCDVKRCHEGCAAGLCDSCCRELRHAAA